MTAIGQKIRAHVARVLSAKTKDEEANALERAMVDMYEAGQRRMLKRIQERQARGYIFGQTGEEVH